MAKIDPLFMAKRLKTIPFAGLQITVVHQTMADQKFANVRRNHNLRRTFCRANFLLQHLTISFANKI